MGRLPIADGLGETTGRFGRAAVRPVEANLHSDCARRFAAWSYREYACRPGARPVIQKRLRMFRALEAADFAREMPQLSLAA